MTWNYRVLRFTEPHTHYALHEVHYEGEIPVAYTENAATFGSEDGNDDILASLEMAAKSLRLHPVLDVAVFDLPKDQRPLCPRSNPKS